MSDHSTNQAAGERVPGRARLFVQLVGGVLGLALLAWAVRIALRAENRGAWLALRDAHASDVAFLFLLTLLSLALNALTFWITLRPVRRVPLGDTFAAHAIASFLTPLPFKLGLVLRGAIHYKRHGVTARELLAWLAGFGGLTAGTLAVLAGAGLWRRTMDGAWWGAVGVGLLALVACVVALGRAAAKSAVLAKLSLGADAIARDARAVAAHVTLRAVDVATFGVRFWIAGRITGHMLSGDASGMLGTTYIALTAAAPAGTLGVTEMGTAGVAKLAGLDVGSVTVLALVITLATTLTSGVGALAGIAWLKWSGRGVGVR